MIRLTAACKIVLLIPLTGFALAKPSQAFPMLPRARQQAEAQPQNQSQKQPQVQAQEKSSPKDQARPGSSAVVSSPSLGEFAREQRAERARSSSPAPRVFTNENLPKSSGGLSIVGPPAGQENAPTLSTSGNETAARLRGKAGDIREQLDTHQRELAVLQQKLGESQVQYYPNPNDTLHQEYSRQDIDRLTLAIEQKKGQIEADQQALSEAEDELAKRGLASNAPMAGAESSPAPKPDLSGVPKDSEQYWRRRFKAAREALKQTQEQQKLAEDELALLQSQQAHEMASGGAAAFDDQISAKRGEVESKRAAAEQAQRDLESLEQEFSKSGSPEAWSQPE